MLSTLLWRSLKYLRYSILSYNRHGIHSKFLYQFLDEVVYQKGEVYPPLLSEYRMSLESDPGEIIITDYGAGSQSNSSRTRKVKDIAKNSSKSKKWTELLYRIIKRTSPATVVELGTSLGITTANLSSAAPESKIITIEGCPETSKVADGRFNLFGLDNIELINGTFEDKFRDTLHKIGKLDFLFIDGNHRGNAILKYLEWSLPYLHTNSVVILDDIYWSRDMYAGWQKIIEKEEIKLSLDLFQIGILFFNADLTKEHYLIRY